VDLSAWPSGTRLSLRKERPTLERSYGSAIPADTASPGFSPTPAMV
jgi:hypothetical protein